MLDSLTMSPIAKEFKTTRVLWQWRWWWGGHAKVVVASEHRCVGGDAAFHRSLPPLLYIYSAGDKTMVLRCLCSKFEPGPFTKVVRWCHGDSGAWYKPTCPYDTLLKSLSACLDVWIGAWNCPFGIWRPEFRCLGGHGIQVWKLAKIPSQIHHGSVWMLKLRHGVRNSESHLFGWSGNLPSEINLNSIQILA
jgi:hypothetical protein